MNTEKCTCNLCDMIEHTTWISVKDKLPDLKETVLSTDRDLIAVTTFRYNDRIKKYCWDYFSSGCGCCDTDMDNVTHWMPLPKPPNEELIDE